MTISTLHTGWQYSSLTDMLGIVTHLVHITPDEDLIRFRDNGTGWTVTEVVGHLRDFEQVFIERADLTVRVDMADLPFPDPDKLATENAYNEQDVDEMLAEWAKLRGQLMEFYKARSVSEWSKVAMHPTRGQLTLYDQLMLHARHDVLHLEQMTRILGEKKTGA